MSRGSAPLHLELRPSRLLQALLLAVHGGALVAALFVPLPWPLRLLVALALLVSLRYSVARWASLSARRAVVALLRDELGEWHATLAGGGELSLRLLPDSYVSGWLVVLNFSGGTRRALPVVILPDMLDRESLRRLRARLRMEGTGESE